MADIRPTYPLARIRERKRGPVPHLEDPVFRSRAVALAATGMSRAGVAAALGRTRQVLHEWLSRGLAEPLVEPWGSFARDYLQAERALEGAAAGTIARWVAALYELAAENPLAVEPAHIQTLLRVQAARYPAEHGVSTHRVPEAELTGAEWLEQHPLEHAQLVQLLSDPPEAVEAAQRETLDTVVMRQLAAGWRPDEASAEALRAVLDGDSGR